MTNTPHTDGISRWVNDLPDYIRRPLRLFVFSFLGLFLVSLSGWLSEVQSWATGVDGAAFPDVRVLGSAAIAASSSALISVISFVWNFLEDKTQVVPSLLKENPTVEQAPLRFPNDDRRTQKEMLPYDINAYEPAGPVVPKIQ